MLFDQNHDGYITKKEIDIEFQVLGEPVTEEELEQSIVSLDKDGDGKISFMEYCMA